MKRGVLGSAWVILGLAAVAAGVARADLVSWYKFDGGSGTVAVDSSGRGNDGTLMGGAAWASGKLDGAIQFNGTDAYVQTQRQIQDSFTLAAWIKTSTAGRAGSQAYEGSGIFWSDVSGAANDFVVAALVPSSHSSVAIRIPRSTRTGIW